MLTEIAILSQVDDWELLRQSAGGDPSAYSELVARYQHAAVVFCRQVLGDHQRAEDVAQRGFINIYLTRDRHEQRAQFKTFLFRVLLNLCLNELSRKPPPIAVTDLGRADAGSAGIMMRDVRVVDPAATLEAREMHDMVAQAIDRLPPKYRAALFLREYEGLAYDEIATALNASLGEVKIWIHRGRKKMLEMLRPYLERGEKPA